MNIIPLKESSGAQFYPQTHEKAVVDSNGVNLQTKLANITSPSYVTAWDGASTPVVANIPAGVVVTYNGTSYTGTLAASASTLNKTYLVATGTANNYYRYVTQLNGSTYSWQNIGSTEIDLSDYAPLEEINQLDQKVGDSTPAPDYINIGDWKTGMSVIGVGGAVGDTSLSASNACTGFIDIRKYAGSTMHYMRSKITSTTSQAGMCFYDADHAPISGEHFDRGAASEGIAEADITVPATAYYVRFSCIQTYVTDFYAYAAMKDAYTSGLGLEVDEITSEIDDIQGDISAIAKETGERKTYVYDSDMLRLGYYRVSGLGVGDTFLVDWRTSSSKKSGVIQLRKGDALTLYTYSTAGSTGALVPYCIVDDSTGKIISIDNTHNPADYTGLPFSFTAPANCTAYIECDLTHESFFSALVSTTVSRIEKRKVKVCIVGNSYSMDSFMYVPFILRNYGIAIELGIYYRSSGSISDQVTEYNSGSNAFYHIDTDTMLRWETLSAYSPAMAVAYTDWDIVVIQQSSTASVDSTTFEPAARNLVELIAGTIGKPFTLGWNININRASSGDSDTIEPTILSNILAAVDSEPVSVIFPYGTAIFDARTNATLDALGDGGHLWASDTIHLQEGLPCYIAALANVQTLFDLFYPGLSVLGDTTTPDADKIAAWNVMGQQGTPIAITDDTRMLAQVCAIVANRYPFAIKTIS